MSIDFSLGDTTEPHIAEYLLRKSWGELEVLEFAGYLLFPETINKRTPEGVEKIDVCLRIPRNNELRKARGMARQLFKKDGLDPEADKDLFDELENLCILSLAIRNRSSPHEPWVPDPEELERNYDKSSLAECWAKIDALSLRVDPRPYDIDKDTMLGMIAAIVKERNISPLVVFGSAAQNTFIVSMADLLTSFLESKSSSDQSDFSTQESSAGPS